MYISHENLVHKWVHQWPKESWTKKGAIDNGIYKDPSIKYATYPGYEGEPTGGCRWCCYDSYRTHIAAVLWSNKLKQYVIVTENRESREWSASTKKHISWLQVAIPPDIKTCVIPLSGYTLHRAIEIDYTAFDPKAWDSDKIVGHLISASLKALEEYWEGAPTNANNIGQKEVRQTFIDEVDKLTTLVNTFGYCGVAKKAQLTKLQKMAAEVKAYTAKDKKAFTEKQRKAHERKLLKEAKEQFTKLHNKMCALVAYKQKRYPLCDTIVKCVNTHGLRATYISFCTALQSTSCRFDLVGLPPALSSAFRLFDEILWSKAEFNKTTMKPALPTIMDLEDSYVISSCHQPDLSGLDAERVASAYFMADCIYTTNGICVCDPKDLKQVYEVLTAYVDKGIIEAKTICKSKFVITYDNTKYIDVGCHRFLDEHIRMWALIISNSYKLDTYKTCVTEFKSLIKATIKNHTDGNK